MIASRTRLALLALVASVAGVTGAVTFGSSPASAGDFNFRVMNTSETPPDGVYFRNGPTTSNTDRVAGHGVYAGDVMNVDCYVTGEAVGSYGNGIWYKGRNATRPTVYSTGAPNEGYLNTHYVDDGQTANHAYPGVPVCGSTPPPPPPAPPITTTYFSPSAGELLPTTPSVKSVGVTSWSNPNVPCDTSRALGTVPGTTTMMSGWSVGRLGPVYALARATPAQRQQLNYILMIDPGGYNQMSTGCDNRPLQLSTFSVQYAGQILATWLKENPQAKLVILAGNVTTDVRHPVNGYASAGIQNMYFNHIRAAGPSARSRTTVCNYSVPGTNVDNNDSVNESHKVMYAKARPFIGAAPLTSCPALDRLTRGATWHP